MLEIVTNVVGELEDAGDDLVNELAFIKRPPVNTGAGFIGRLIQSVIRLSTADSTKQQLQVIVEKQQAIQATLEEKPMGQLADALRVSGCCRIRCQTFGRSTRTKAVSALTTSATTAAIPGQLDAKSLLGKGNFRQQTVSTLSGARRTASKAFPN